MREKILQDKCIRYLKEKKIYHINKYGDGRSAKGAPDLYVCISGKFVCFELKVGYNDLQDDQKIHKLRIERSGGLHFAPYTFEEFKEIVDSLNKGEQGLACAIDEFYTINYRVPTLDELKALGYNINGIKSRGEYRRFLESLGYDSMARPKYIIDVIDDGEVVFTGSVREIAEEYAISDQTIHLHLKEKTATRDGLRFVKFSSEEDQK